ncbi:5-guanidino-2-oxopentanoate decarboxylase [Kiloniella antarctica]|uniref:5-guanidino-2-oxopentanoate decarboxylase n=1 Tax=Kiloniella antarctica TaxID=1550907 RepID=A0ABW5BL18_9PROT
MTLGEYLIKLLESYDVDRVFGIPGVHTVELYRGLAQSKIIHHTPRHEQGAGFMADGYARVSGKPGVCLVITGPGLTNIATAMAQAYADSIPMLVISGVNRLKDQGHGNGHLHELPNQTAFAEQISAFSYSVTDPTDLPQAMARAFALFNSSRPRPVHIEIPIDLMSACADHLPLSHNVFPLDKPQASSQAIAQAAELCSNASAPLLIVGGGYKGDHAIVRELAEALDSPVVMTVNARGLLPEEHPLAVPASPSLSTVRELIAQSDVVLAVGTELGPTDFDMYYDGNFAVPGSLIRLDIDPTQIHRNAPADLALVGDAELSLSALLLSMPKISPQNIASKGAQKAAIVKDRTRSELTPEMNRQIEFLQQLNKALPGAIIVGDSTQVIYTGNLYFSPDQSKGWINSATGFGTLGYALSAAIGAKLASPKRPVICLVGDGGIQFTLGELGAAMDAQTPIIILVWNNNGYREIKSFMVDNQITPEGVDLSTPDFAAIAQAYGLQAEHLSSADDLINALERAVASQKPALIQIEEHLYHSKK